MSTERQSRNQNDEEAPLHLHKKSSRETKTFHYSGTDKHGEDLPWVELRIMQMHKGFAQAAEVLAPDPSPIFSVFRVFRG